MHQLADYDRERGISLWRKNYRTGLELEDAGALDRSHAYYDPIHTLPEAGRRWWAENATLDLDAETRAARSSRDLALLQTP